MDQAVHDLGRKRGRILEGFVWQLQAVRGQVREHSVVARPTIHRYVKLDVWVCCGVLAVDPVLALLGHLPPMVRVRQPGPYGPVGLGR